VNALLFLLNDARKAGAAGVVAFLTPLGVLLGATDQPITVRTVVASAVAGVIAYALTFTVPNRDTSGYRDDDAEAHQP